MNVDGAKGSTIKRIGPKQKQKKIVRFFDMGRKRVPRAPGHSSFGRMPLVTTYTITDTQRRGLVTLKRRVARPKSRNIHFWPRQVPAAITALVIFAAFGFGMWVRQNTPPSAAEKNNQAGTDTLPANNQSFVASFGNAPTGTTSSITNDILFNTPIEYLQSYFESPAPTPDIEAIRAEKLVQYLKSKGSPFAKEADVIAKQNHWKLILAISYAESTLGKKCYYNNCSGIGGANIKTYDSLKSWIVDFNKLLERRYKNKTLEQMCGVYVQPCNPNWLLATKQILEDIKERGIE